MTAKLVGLFIRILVGAVVAFAIPAHAQWTVNFAFTNRLTLQPDTNWFRVTPVGTNIMANGGVLVNGPGVRIYPDTNGTASALFGEGWYMVTNTETSPGIVFAVPEGQGTANMTDLAHSGLNLYSYTAPNLTSLTAGSSNIIVTLSGHTYTIDVNLLSMTNIAAVAVAPLASTNSVPIDPVTQGLVQSFDTDSTIITTNSNRVIFASDLSGNGNNWTQSNTNFSPTLVYVGGRRVLNFGTWAETRWMTNATVPLNTASMTVIAVHYTQSDWQTDMGAYGPNTFGQCLLGGSVGGIWPGLFLNVDFSGNVGGGGPTTAMGVSTSSGGLEKATWLSAGSVNTEITSFTFTSTNIFLRNMEREEVLPQIAANTCNGAGLGIFFGLYAFHGNIEALRIYNRPLSATELRTEESYLRFKHGIPQHSYTQIAFDGDSITWGIDATNGLTWPRQLALLRNFDGYNVANGSKTIGPDATGNSMLVNWTNTLGTAVNTNDSTHILLAWGGSNDRSFYGEPGINIAGWYSNYCTGIKAATPWKVIIATMIPRYGTDEPERNILNAILRTNWPAFADGLADLAADPRFAAGAQTNSIYYAVDSVHLTPAGYSVVADIFDRAIAGLPQASIPNGTFIRTLNGGGTNTILLNPSLTNGVNRGNAFSSLGSGTQSEQFGAGATATGLQSYAAGNSASASSTSSTAIGASSLASANQATALGELSTASGVASTAIGFNATVTTDHEIGLGTSSEFVYAPGKGSFGGITNRGVVSAVVGDDSNGKEFAIVLDPTLALTSGTLAVAPLGITSNQIALLTIGTNNISPAFYNWLTNITQGIQNFGQLGPGTNTTSLMDVGTGASLVPSGSGIIVATAVLGLGANHISGTNVDGYVSNAVASVWATNVPSGGTIGSLGVTVVGGNSTRFLGTTADLLLSDASGGYILTHVPLTNSAAIAALSLIINNGAASISSAGLYSGDAQIRSNFNQYAWTTNAFIQQEQVTNSHIYFLTADNASIAGINGPFMAQNNGAATNSTLANVTLVAPITIVNSNGVPFWQFYSNNVLVIQFDATNGIWTSAGLSASTITNTGVLSALVLGTDSNGKIIAKSTVSGSSITNSGLTSADAIATDSNGKLIQATAILMSHIAQPGLILTNGNVNDVTMSNNFRIDIAHSLSVSNLTASRMVLSSAADALSSAAASGAVPIDADGSATTLAQINALGTVSAATTATYVTGNNLPLTNSISSTNNVSHLGLTITNDITGNFGVITNGGMVLTNLVTGDWLNLTNDALISSNKVTALMVTVTNGSIILSNTAAASLYSQLNPTNLIINTGTAGSNTLWAANGTTPLTVFTNGGGWFQNDVSEAGFFKGDLNPNRIYWNTNGFPLAAGAINVDFRAGYQFITTNANFTVAGFINGSNSIVNQVWVSVSNSSASGITMTWPGAPVRMFGTNTATSGPIPAGKVWKGLFQLDPHGTNLIWPLMQNN